MAWPSSQRWCRPHLTAEKTEAQAAQVFAKPQRTPRFEPGCQPRRTRPCREGEQKAGVGDLRGSRGHAVQSGSEGKPYPARGSAEVWRGFLGQAPEQLPDERLRFGGLTHPARTTPRVRDALGGGTEPLAPTCHLCSFMTAFLQPYMIEFLTTGLVLDRLTTST